MNNRIENYHLDFDLKYQRWILWTSYYNDWEPSSHWEAYNTVLASDAKDIDEVTAAILLLMYYWETVRVEEDIDAFHWIGSEGILRVKELKAIAAVVWTTA